MSLELVEDDRVLEAALSLLDHQSDNDEGPVQATTSECSSPCNKKRKTRSYNPNRAREAQTKELLDLRAQVPRLEKSLEALQQKLTMEREDAGTMELWKKLALHERKTRKSATEENRRLRALVREANEASTRTMQTLLQTRPDHVQTFGSLSTVPDPEPGPSRRLYALPVDPSDRAVFREMADSIDTVHRQVLQVFSDVEAASFPSTEKAHGRAFADKILPFDVEAVSDAAWQFFAHSFRRPTTRFFYHTESLQSTELVSDDTVIEVFGEEHRFDQTLLLAIKVRQIVRRYVAAGRVVIAWRALLGPQQFKTETLRDVVYEEDGALVIEPFAPRGPSCSHDASTVVHTWQKVTPKLSGLQSELAQELTAFVLRGCRPGRAVQSMERTLRARC